MQLGTVQLETVQLENGRSLRDAERRRRHAHALARPRCAHGRRLRGTGANQTTVQPGDTLWSVAQRIAPDNDPREVVAQIRRINHLHTSALQAGQLLLLPTAAK